MPQERNNLLFVIVGLALLSSAFIILTGSTVRLTTIQYDEFTDLVIASSLSENPLSGHSYDASQARFPMYVTAAAVRLLKMANLNLKLLEFLIVSRWFSILMTVLAIFGTYLLGSRLFGVASGLIAAALFTFSPFVLHFGRDALTQGDAFTSATVLFSLITFETFQRKRTTFWLFCFSFCLALAISAKFLSAILLPALVTYQVLVTASQRYREPDRPVTSASRLRTTGANRPFIFLSIATGISALLAFVINSQRLGLAPSTSNLMLWLARIFWVAALLGVFICGTVALRHFRAKTLPAVKVDNGWSLGEAWLAILPLAFAVVLAVFPEHTFNPSVLSSLVSRFLTMDGNSNPFAATLDSAKLYLGLLLLKPGLPLGIATLITLVWAVKRSIKEKGILLLVLVLAYYALLLAVLPLQQPFWLMTIYPLILLLLSAMIVRGYSGFKNNTLRIVWAGFFVGAVVWLAVGLAQVYPTFGYYGYELIGNEWLGDESRGYRKVVVITNDGSTEAIDWLRQNVPADARVISYLNDVHLINHLAKADPFIFNLKQAVQYSDKNELSRDLARADFVVVRVPDDIGLHAPVNDPAFVQRYGPEPAYQITRGRGVYRMPVIQIYQRQTNSVLVAPGLECGANGVDGTPEETA